MNNFTFGQYLKGNSWIYKVDPRIKIVGVVILMIALFIVPNLYGMMIAFGLFLAVFLSTRISLIKMIKGLKPLLFLMTFTFILQVLSNERGNIIFTLKMHLSYIHMGIFILLFLLYLFTSKKIRKKMLYLLFLVFVAFLIQNKFVFQYEIKTYEIKLYEGALVNGAFMLIRIFIIIGITSLLTFSTMTNDINAGLEGVLKPFKRILPIDEIAMMLSLTLRFIPTLIDETQKIMNAQASRGVDFREGKLKEKTVQIISLLIPMFVVSFKRADELSNAMEARGYVIGKPRTRIDVLKLKPLDYISLGMMLSILAISIVCRFI